MLPSQSLHFTSFQGFFVAPPHTHTHTHQSLEVHFSQQP